MITSEALAKFIAEMLDGVGAGESLGAWVNAHVDSDPGSVWVELTSTETDGGRGRCFRLTIEPQP